MRSFFSGRALHFSRLLGGSLVFLGLAILFWTAYAKVRTEPAPCPSGCSVILIVIDTLGAQHIGAYGYERDTMPLTTAFFEKNGVIFDDVTSAASWTFPSFAAIYFSDTPSSVTYSDYEGLTNRPQLFSALRNAGVQMLGIQFFNSPITGYFILDAVYGLAQEGEKIRASDAPSRLSSDSATAKKIAAQEKFSAAERALESLGSSRTPFFMMMHFLLVHDPYTTTAPYNTHFSDATTTPVVTMDMILSENKKVEHASSTVDTYRLRYDQNIAQMDALLSDFLDSLSTTTLSHTAIIVTADHGEAFDEHGELFHGFSLYQEELHVPFFMHIPGISPRRIREPISLMDIAPTILELQGVSVPESFTGASLIPLLTGKKVAPRVLPFEMGYPDFLDVNNIEPGDSVPPTLRAAGVYGSGAPIVDVSGRGARYGVYKLIVHDGPPVQEEFYNLATDPEERHNLLTGPLSQDATRAYEVLHTSL